MRALIAAAALIVALGFVRPADAQPQHVDVGDGMRGTGEAPDVLLLTFGEGVQIFEKYGHAALCLHYPTAPVFVLPPRIAAELQPMADKAGLPVGALESTTCFNYGVTNFRDGAAIVWNFLRGKQRFWVDTESMGGMIAFYSGQTPLGQQLEEDRDVWMQKLPLSPEQASRLADKLYSNTLEENRFYFYDHFFDNCTTRLRDMIDDASDHKLHDGADQEYGPTFRALGYAGIAEYPPLVAAGDFYAGRQLDDHPTIWLAMFHPDILRKQVTDKLGVKPVLLYARTGPPFPQTGSNGHVLFFLIAAAFALPLLVALLLRARRWVVTAAVAFATLELFVWGLIIWGAAIASSIPGLRWNENVFVFMPLDIVLPFLGERRRRGYARIRLVGLLLVSLLDLVGVFHQPLWIPILTAFMPLALLGLWPARPAPAVVAVTPVPAPKVADPEPEPVAIAPTGEAEPIVVAPADDAKPTT